MFNILLVFNCRSAYAARIIVLGLSFCLCLFVRLSVTSFSAATRNKTATKRYQRVQCHTDFISKMAILIKMLHSKAMARKPSEQANMLIGERERANLVVRSSGIFCLYIYIYVRRRTSCKCACAASYTLLFSEIISKFLHIGRCLAVCAGRSSERTLSPHSTACAATFGD